MIDWPGRMRMKYKTAEGTESERTVLFNRASRTHLVAYCTTRKSSRTFRLDRIVDGEVIDMETGEVINVR